MTLNSEANEDTCNGANVVIWTPNEEILMVCQSYHEQTWGLPGGALKVGEGPGAAARRETREETGLVLSLDLRLIAQLAQLTINTSKVTVPGQLSLYTTQYYPYQGEIVEDVTGEISDARFMSLPEIFCGKYKDKVGLGYKRMIAIWQKQLHSSRIYDGALRDKVSINLNNKVLNI